MNRLTSEELREMREYTGAATAGPWLTDGYGFGVDAEIETEDGGGTGIASTYDGEYIENRNHKADATFIAKARTDMPRLLDEVERLTSEVKRERDANDGLLDIIRDLVELHEDDVVERPAVALAKSVLIGK